MIIPAELRKFLGKYGAQFYDSYSGEEIGWGFEIVERAGSEAWAELGRLGDLECSYPKWYLITKWLTREEAIEKYGQITNEEFGPRGGFKSVTFGDKKFSSRHLMKGKE